MIRRLRENARYVATILALAVVGLVAAGAVLVKERFPIPFRDDYVVRVVIPTADGVAPGLGQGVNVSGVRVGSISGARIVGTNAELELAIERDQLPRVYRNARADLRPITPVKDMELDLDPGDRSAPALPPGGTIPVGRNSSPVPLADLLSTLDADTRTFLTSLLTGLGRGTKGRAPDLRRILLSLGPTSAQVGQLARALDGRRRDIASLVHDTAAVTRAAAADGRLSDLVVAGNRTLQALGRQDRPLREILAQVPGTLRTAGASLQTVGQLSDQLGPTVEALTPSLRKLPATFADLRGFTDGLTPMLRTQLRPLVVEAQPLARRLGPTLDALSKVTPGITRVAQAANYVLNEVGYNPPGKDEGMLFWLAWFAHNWNSVASGGDAHGAILRVALNVSCEQITGALDLAPLFRLLLGASNICPVTPAP
ncbi:putative Mce family protein [Patulibacter medicamentivorans]|uniref:Putative Mce family protein n=1 Tax=Patulibacter medicamentivorans TaxID=1097667 RepID=H0E4W6_9ACTN|nr:MlaD family protein [Patulibacter medicamentivorans]EHN11283.1 putative Mce family protein [Patulibacter medicamentivorans]